MFGVLSALQVMARVRREERIHRKGRRARGGEEQRGTCLWFELPMSCDVEEGWWVLLLFRPIFGLKFVIIFQANHGLGYQRSAAS